jgi:uncharacterized protein YbjT (DUF2867 family)
MKILVTGATGFVGRRLVERLRKEKGLRLRLFVRQARAVADSENKQIEVVEGDTFTIDSLDRALKGIHTAYYLIHSMASKEGDYEELDRKSAENFRDACIRNKVRRIIYLGGLGSRESSSRHLKSRIETGDILSGRPGEIQTIWFRASIIIGSGGASFEIIRHLVQKLPVMVAPRWVRTVTQPIGIGDVLDYLAGALHVPVTHNLTVDIGGERISFQDMLLVAASAFGLRRRIIPVPLFSPRLSSYWLVFITPVPFSIASALVEGLKYETVLLNDNAKKFFPSIEPASYDNALAVAVNEIENDQVLSRWCDGSAGVCYERDAAEVSRAVFTKGARALLEEVPPRYVFERVLAIGGEKGWFSMNLLWKLRGLADKLAGGPGLARGRRERKGLRLGDALDFWKVVDLVENERLLLLSQMRLPGKAWLEFTIHDGMLTATAYFIPRGLLGRAYWFMMYPPHVIVFRKMAHTIVAGARSDYNKNYHSAQ